MNTVDENLERQTLDALMSLFSGVKRALVHRLRGQATVPPMLLRVLLLCERQPGITQQQLARLTGRDKGQIARMVRELLDQGLLLREEHPDDRRSHRLRPSEAGCAAVRAFEQAQAAVAQWLFEGTDPGAVQALREQLRRLSERTDSLPDSEDGEDGADRPA